MQKEPKVPEGTGPSPRAVAHALGRSRGGYGTKACLVSEGRGRALGFALLPGERSELKAAERLLVAVRRLGPLGRVICDRGYSSASWRAGIRLLGGEPVVPSNRTHPQVAYDRAAYGRRHRVEQLWGRLKEWRAVATRYEKTASSYLGVLYVAAAIDWINHPLT